MNLTFTKEDFEQFILDQDPEREVDNSYVYSALNQCCVHTYGLALDT